MIGASRFPKLIIWSVCLLGKNVTNGFILSYFDFFCFICQIINREIADKRKKIFLFGVISGLRFFGIFGAAVNIFQIIFPVLFMVKFLMKNFARD